MERLTCVANGNWESWNREYLEYIDIHTSSSSLPFIKKYIILFLFYLVSQCIFSALLLNAIKKNKKKYNSKEDLAWPEWV